MILGSSNERQGKLKNDNTERAHQHNTAHNYTHESRAPSPSAAAVYCAYVFRTHIGMACVHFPLLSVSACCSGNVNVVSVT